MKLLYEKPKFTKLNMLETHAVMGLRDWYLKKLS